MKVDPADDGDDITGAANQVINPPSRGIHCDTNGTITFVLSGKNKQMTRTMTGGVLYPYCINKVVAVAGGFTGGVVR